MFQLGAQKREQQKQVTAAKVAQLAEMGFGEAAARRALERSEGDVSRAVEALSNPSTSEAADGGSRSGEMADAEEAADSDGATSTLGLQPLPAGTGIAAERAKHEKDAAKTAARAAKRAARKAADQSDDGSTDDDAKRERPRERARCGRARYRARSDFGVGPIDATGDAAAAIAARRRRNKRRRRRRRGRGRGRSARAGRRDG